MAGLLDFMNTDEGMQGMGLLSAAAPSMAPMNLAGRMAQAGASYRGMQDNQLRNEFIKSQITENSSQADMRKQQLLLAQRKMDWQSSILGYGGNTQGGEPTSIGAYTTPADGVGPTMPTPTQGTTPSGMGASGNPMTLDAISQRYKIPVESLKFDVVNNDGKGISDMIFKRGAPDMQVSGNFAYDKNSLGAGFMPSLSTSQTGQTSMTRIGADGLPIVSAPSGALDTYREYKDAEAGKKPFKVYNKATGQEEYTTEKAVVDAAGGGGSAPGPVAVPLPGAAPSAWKLANPGINPIKAQPGESDAPRLLSEQLAEAKQRLSGSKTSEDINRATSDINGIQGEMKKMGIAVSSNFAAGPSVAEKQAADAAGKFTGGRVENIVKYEDGLNSRVNEGANLNMRLQESLKTMDNFTNGGGKETRAKLAQMAQAIGAPDKVINGIAGGDLASMQEFNKLSVQQAMESLKQSMGGAGRIAQAEFKIFQANNPNLDTDSRAVRKIFDFNTRVFQRDLAEQQAFNKHVDSGGNPAQFPLKWSGDQASAGFTDPKLSAKLTEKPPTPMKGMTRGGYKFKGGDASNSANWEKQ